MNNTFRTWLLLFPLVALLAGCIEKPKNPKPENLIPEDDYIDLLIELQLLKSYRASFPPDSAEPNIDSLKALIYDKYHVNEEQFLRSHRYFQSQVEPQVERVTNAIDSLKEQMVKDGLMDSSRLQ
ncbi:DUF4296 domain-containing protein [Aliifodinibius sp. S!AR15-10]|uniref:DUF4296 domain-containing protein n=1 Tax=Aliifodinibius sp. S!AR15-10 TaxID=2950437 RepID=UPI00286645A0|nr:DUF4296 domain-containing protein [Aliifodinibius sp. S!AR15-10]MDR8392179.1 DUF4296 domain-containing protein [Aliifodinibius sp. S!AR15-10]